MLIDHNKMFKALLAWIGVSTVILGCIGWYIVFGLLFSGAELTYTPGISVVSYDANKRR